MKGSRRNSFISAVDQSFVDIESTKYRRFTLFDKMVKTIASKFLDDPRDRQYYADTYKCCPPPWFIISVTILEVCKDTFR